MNKLEIAFIIMTVYAAIMTGGYIEQTHKDKKKKSRAPAGTRNAASKI